MDPENTDITEQTSASAAIDQQPGTPPAEVKPVASGRTFTQEEVDRIASKAREDGRKAAAKPVAAPAPKPSATSAAQADVMTVEQHNQIRSRERAFDRAVGNASLSDRQIGRMEAAFRGDNPQDVSSWCTEYLADMGLNRKPPVTQPATQPVAPTATTPEAPRVPAMAPSAPSGHGLPTQNGITDLFALTPSQLKDLSPTGVRKVLEQLSQIGNDQAGIPQRPKPPSQR